MKFLDAQITRRTFILSAGAAAAATLMPKSLLGREENLIQRAVPASGERLPAIGMGTWQSFDVGDDPEVKSRLAEVLQTFFDLGGRVIDSSPMYGRSESVVGELLSAIGKKPDAFAATKVWTDGRGNGIEQMQQSMQRIGVQVMDLMQIHNLRDWHTHLPVLKEWKQMGRLRYIGVTTSHGRYHRELEQLMRNEPFDFVQFTYNLENRVVEERLLPLAADRGIATLINRPFQGGALFRKVQDIALPAWSAAFDCRSWAQFFLKFIVAHPAVTCVIPATSKVSHMQDNMAAGYGRLPDAGLRKKMTLYYASLGG